MAHAMSPFIHFRSLIWRRSCAMNVSSGNDQTSMVHASQTYVNSECAHLSSHKIQASWVVDASPSGAASTNDCSTSLNCEGVFNDCSTALFYFTVPLLQSTPKFHSFNTLQSFTASLQSSIPSLHSKVPLLQSALKFHCLHWFLEKSNCDNY